MPPIETLQDWNNRMPCCCAIPGCPMPELVCESLAGEVRAVGYGTFSSSEPTLEINQQMIHTYGGGGVVTYGYDTCTDVRFAGQWLSNPVSSEVANNGLPQTGTLTVSYAVPVTIASIRADGLTIMDAAKDWNDSDLVKENACATSYDPDPFYPGVSLVLTVIFWRYKWRIPDTFTGNYFKITWDVVERSLAELGEPENRQVDDPPVDPSFIENDTTWEWTRPEIITGPESFESAWYEAILPTAEAQREIFNIRYACRRPEDSRYGVKPELLGESYELPPP